MTGFPNKRLFIDRLEKCIIEAIPNKKALGVLFLDLDSFKRVNDTMGHVKGDELLKMVSKKLLNTIKESDTVCRVGGDEFLILIRNLDDENYIREISEEILNTFKNSFIIDSNELYKEMKLINCLYKAIERNEFELYYQPQVSVISGKIIGLEALIRWNSAELGRVSPVDFIHISEKTGLILPIGEWVLKAACSQNKKGMTMEYLMYQ